MSSTTDIFGLAFKDYLGGETEEEIIVNIDKFGDDELPVSYFFRDYNAMPLWEQMVLDVCRGKVLDAGAGAGSHALYLQEKGLEVTAVDVSEGAVLCMQQRGVKNAVCMDFYKLPTEKYDTILFLMNGAGMAQKIHMLQTLLEKAAGMLNPDGAIFLESTDLLYMFEEEDGSAMIDLAGDYYGEVVYTLRYKQYSGEPFPWLFVDFDNLKYIAGQAGLQCQEFFRGETDNFVAKLTLPKL